MREQRTYGSVRGAISDDRPYRDLKLLDANSSFISVNARNGAATVRERVWTKRKGISETGE